MLYKNFNSDIKNRIDYCCIKNTHIIYSNVINQLNYNNFIDTIKRMLLSNNYIILENEYYHATMEQIIDIITIVKINKNDTDIKDVVKNSIHVEFKVNKTSKFEKMFSNYLSVLYNQNYKITNIK
tara:strand:- start:4085 stop:4459 length:375 start_codon:yes stop_codon:yes gene_type:complete